MSSRTRSTAANRHPTPLGPLPYSVSAWLNDPRAQHIHELHVIIEAHKKELDTVYQAWQDVADKLDTACKEVERLTNLLYSADTDAETEDEIIGEEPIESVRRRLLFD